ARNFPAVIGSPPKILGSGTSWPVTQQPNPRSSAPSSSSGTPISPSRRRTAIDCERFMRRLPDSARMPRRRPGAQRAPSLGRYHPVVDQLPRELLGQPGAAGRIVVHHVLIELRRSDATGNGLEQTHAVLRRDRTQASQIVIVVLLPVRQRLHEDRMDGVVE